MGPTVTTGDLKFLRDMSYFIEAVTLREVSPCEASSRVKKLCSMGLIDIEPRPRWKGFRYKLTKRGREILRMRTRTESKAMEAIR